MVMVHKPQTKLTTNGKITLNSLTILKKDFIDYNDEKYYMNNKILILNV
jgi:hypothetical protein